MATKCDKTGIIFVNENGSTLFFNKIHVFSEIEKAEIAEWQYKKNKNKQKKRKKIVSIDRTKIDWDKPLF